MGKNHEFEGKKREFWGEKSDFGFILMLLMHAFKLCSVVNRKFRVVIVCYNSEKYEVMVFLL